MGSGLSLRVARLSVGAALLGFCLFLGGPSHASADDPPSCRGRRVFVVDLPEDFNKGLAVPETADAWANDGFGRPFDAVALPTLLPDAFDTLHFPFESHPSTARDAALNQAKAWLANLTFPDLPTSFFRTDSYSLGIISYHRMLSYPCRTSDYTEANAIYVPYLAHEDIAKQLVDRSKGGKKGKLSTELLEHLCDLLEQQPAWQQTDGVGFFTISGSPGWNLMKPWGPGLSDAPCMQNVITMSVENNRWLNRSVSAPVPSIFHPPNSSALSSWLAFVKSTHQDRPLLVSMLGSVTASHPLAYRLQRMLRYQCTSLPHCWFVDTPVKGKVEKEAVLALYLASTFCVQPRGATCSSREMIDSILAGCIPVVFENCSLNDQWKWHLQVGQRKPFFVQIPLGRLTDPLTLGKNLPPCINPHSSKTGVWPEGQFGRSYDCLEENVTAVGAKGETMWFEDFLSAIPPKEVRSLQKQGLWLIARTLYGGSVNEDGNLLPPDFKDSFDLLVEAAISGIGTLRKQQLAGAPRWTKSKPPPPELSPGEDVTLRREAFGSAGPLPSSQPFTLTSQEASLGTTSQDAASQVIPESPVVSAAHVEPALTVDNLAVPAPVTTEQCTVYRAMLNSYGPGLFSWSHTHTIIAIGLIPLIPFILPKMCLKFMQKRKQKARVGA